MAKRYISAPLSLAHVSPVFSRADIEFHGVDHSEASYEARIFLNNPEADEATETTAVQGYAGSFHIFGHGGCYGDDEAHCDATVPRRPYDPRPAHPLVPTTKVVIATEAIRHLLEGEGAREATVTVVPIVTWATDRCDLEDVLRFDHLRVVTYL